MFGEKIPLPDTRSQELAILANTVSVLTVLTGPLFSRIAFSVLIFLAGFLCLIAMGFWQRYENSTGTYANNWLRPSNLSGTVAVVLVLVSILIMTHL